MDNFCVLNQAGIPSYTDLSYQHLGMGTVYRLFIYYEQGISDVERYKIQKLRYLRK